MERFEFKIAGLAVDDLGAITGLAAVFGTADRGGDIIHKGAFAGAKVPMPMFASHDAADVIGVWDELTEVPEGLAVKGRLLIQDVRRAGEVRALIKAGAMQGLSIGYVATKKAARKGGGRDLFQVDLMEISVVAMPMHPDAKITSTKSNEGNTMTLEEMQAELAKAETKGAAAVETAVAAAVAPYIARLDKIEAKAARPANDGGGAVEITPERKAFCAYLSLGQTLPEADKKTLVLSDNPLGGFLSPPELMAEVIRGIQVFNPMRALASVRAVSTRSVIYPTRDDITAATWHGEGATKTESGITFGQITGQVHEQSTIVRISNTLLQDAPQAEAEVRLALSEDFGKSEGVAFLNGTGAANNQPEGLMTNAAVPLFANGHAANLSADALIKMLYSMPAMYRNAGTWAMNGKTLGVLRTLKDGDGRFLWQPAFVAGQPETILGRPVVELPDMPDIAANATPILYGDFAAYRVLDRAYLSVLSDPYSLAANGETRLIATRRVGGFVLQPVRFLKLKMATTV